MVWFSLFLASICEVLWATSLKFLDFKKIKSNLFNNGFFSSSFWLSFLPLVAYIFFGISNISLFSYACKFLPLTICYSLWMGLALTFQTLIDVFYFKENITKNQLIFLGILLIGIVGLRITFQK